MYNYVDYTNLKIFLKMLIYIIIVGMITVLVKVAFKGTITFVYNYILKYTEVIDFFAYIDGDNSIRKERPNIWLKLIHN